MPTCQGKSTIPNTNENIGDYYVMSIKSDEEFDAFLEAWQRRDVYSWEILYMPPKESFAQARIWNDMTVSNFNPVENVA